jgi:tetratricopeptide (TPR) repeat protein
MASYLHLIRVLSNKPHHDVEQVRLQIADAENVLGCFLRVLEWFYQDCPAGPHLPTIYTAEAQPPLTAHATVTQMMEAVLRGQRLQQAELEQLRGQQGARPAKAWRPRVCYPLQPAPHFQGRQRLRADLAEWARSRVSPDRVVSLVAVGGTGKTALAERVLFDLGEQPSAGVLVWSFYEDPRTEGFLRTACEYFTGEAPPSAGGLLERLQVALTGDEPHLLVLDGLERVQAEGTTGRRRGEIEDPQLRRLLRWLAAGLGTRTRALVTSRFPLVDLDDWKGAGHREERLEDLEPAAARSVLRGWGVKGDEATLDRLAAPLHCHALSVAVLGSYLGKLWGGDPTKAPTFDRDEEAAADPKAAKLNRILTHYAEKLPDAERDLLARLSTFHRGVTVEFLGFVVEAGGQVAGALAGCNQVRLLRLLEQLRDLGLVFRYDMPQGPAFTAHPFLRDYFRDLLGVTRPQEIHEVVRERLAPSLEGRPARKPTDRAMLDRYEALIEHTRLAGRTQEAFDLYWYGLGHSKHLSAVLGDNARGLRILTAFSSDGTPETAAVDLPGQERSPLVCDWGRYAENLGDLGTARRALRLATGVLREEDDSKNLSIALQNQAEVELLAGLLLVAREAATAALAHAKRAEDERQIANSHTDLGTALAWLGKLDDARRHFAAATKLEDEPQLYSLRGIWEAEFKLEVGDRPGAAAQTQANLDIAVWKRWAQDQALCGTLLGRLALPADPPAARRHLDAARNYCSRSDHVEVQLRCYHLACEIARTEQDFDLARSEAEAGIHLADTCGFGHYGIELRLALARVHLDAGDPKAALQKAHEALERSVHPECQYAWGEADGLHLCGVAHARLGEVEPARQHLTAARARRERLNHPGLDEIRSELERLGK